MCLLYEKVAGVTFKNEDGSSRQKYIRQLKEDDSLTFESFEYEGETALHVLDAKGHCIGNVPKDVVPTILDYYNKGYKFDITVLELHGKDDFGDWLEGYNAGVTMCIYIYRKEDAPVFSTSPGYVPKTPDPVLSSLPKKKKGSVAMILFGCFFLLMGFANPLCFVVGIILLLNGVVRRKQNKGSETTPCSSPENIDVL